VTGTALDADALFAALAGHRVRYVLIGSLALAAHGYVRATADVDIVPAPDRENLERLAAALGELDARLVGGELLPEVALDAEALQGGANFPVETRYGRLDVMQDEPGIPPYDELAARATVVTRGELEIRVCSRGDLIAMKRAADRDIDRVDLARLEKIDGP
jgi:hypothetical protein